MRANVKIKNNFHTLDFRKGDHTLHLRAHKVSPWELETENILETFKIHLNSFDKVKEFIKVTNRLDCNIDLRSGRFVVDGKSPMGIFSLDLTKPIEVSIIQKDVETNYFPKELETFIVNES